MFYFQQFMDLTRQDTLLFLKPATSRRYAVNNLSGFDKHKAYQEMFSEAEYTSFDRVFENTPPSGVSKCFESKSDKFYVCYLQVQNQHCSADSMLFDCFDIDAIHLWHWLEILQDNKNNQPV